MKMKKSTNPIDEILPIEEFEKLHLPDLSADIKCHIEQYVEDQEGRDGLKRMIMISLREWMNKTVNSSKLRNQ